MSTLSGPGPIKIHTNTTGELCFPMVQNRLALLSRGRGVLNTGLLQDMDGWYISTLSIACVLKETSDN